MLGSSRPSLGFTPRPQPSREACQRRLQKRPQSSPGPVSATSVQKQPRLSPGLPQERLAFPFARAPCSSQGDASA